MVKKKQTRSFGGFYLPTFYVTFIVDHITKCLALRYLGDQPVRLLPGINLTLGLNRGVSFGWFSSLDSAWKYRLLLVAIFIALVILSRYTGRGYRLGRDILPEVLIFAGGFSNLYDRIWLGAVIDFIDLYVLDYHWYTFNIADVCIVVGAILLFIRLSKEKHA